MHYDPQTGQVRGMQYDIKTKKVLDHSYLGRLPADMPRRYPKKQIAAQLSTPDSYLIPGVPPKGSGTAAGRRRIGVMQLS